MTRIRTQARALAALLLLTALLVGAPILLASIPNALDLHLPVDGIASALMRPDDGSLLLLALLAVGWICWAAFAVATAAELVAGLRGLPAPRIPGLGAPQRMAGALIAAVALLAPTAGTSAPTPPAQPATSATATVATIAPASYAATAAAATTAKAAPSERIQHAPQASAPTGECAYRVITVHRHDTLWGLAETHLGAGERWPEIYRLNRGHPQPDGRELRDPDWIYPGWQLRLPHQADHEGHDVSTRRNHDTAKHATAPKHAGPSGQNQTPDTAARHYWVRAGDTLWDIAGTHLGDPTRWREIYQLNKNQPQPDGGRLTDAALIMPGWRLRLPDTHHARPAAPPRQAQHDDPATPAEPRTTPPRASTPHPTTPTAATSQSPQPVSPSARPDLPGAVAPPAGVAEPIPEADGPTSAPRTLEPREPQAPPTETAVVAEDTDDDPASSEGALLPLLGLGLSAATLTGLVTEVRRRRRRQQSSRRPGQRIPMPGPDVATRETTARVHTIPGTVEAITTALRALAAACRRTGRPLPDLLLVHAAADGVRVQLTEPDPDPVPPFTAVDDVTWLLTHDPATLPTADSDPYPTLVALGIADGAMVLLNLEAVGTLTLTGAPERVAATLRALAADVAVGPFCGAAALTFTGAMFEPLADTLDLGRGHSTDPGQAARELAHDTATLVGLLDGADLRDARAARGLDDTTGPTLLISELEFSETPHPWSGATLVHPGTQETSRWRLDLPTDGPAILHPAGLALDPQQLRDEDYQAIIDLLRTADVEPGYQLPAGDDPVAVSARVRDALPESPHDTETPSLASPPSASATAGEAPRVLLLGPLEVTGAHDERARHRVRRLTELVAYLALHPDATASQIDEALWPGKRVSANNRAAFISRARHWLDHDREAGGPYLPKIGESGGLSLAKTVTCDWYDFLRHARAGLHGGDPDELTAALDLVRGRPFLGIEDHRYTWAEHDIQQMISTIVDVADALATHHAGLGDHRAALRTALHGLQVDQSAQALLSAGREAARACGDEAEAQRLARLQHLLDDDLPLDDSFTT